jgi:hypothetical protein
MSSPAWHKKIVSTIGDYLKAKGFKKGSNNHIRDVGEITNIVGFQRSTRTVPEALIFTVNIGVNCKLLDELANRPTFKTPVGSHIQRRINEFISMRGDRWWQVTSNEQIEPVCEEIIGILEEFVLPTLDKVRTCRDLLSVWDEGDLRVLTSMFKVDQEHYHEVLSEALS